MENILYNGNQYLLENINNLHPPSYQLLIKEKNMHNQIYNYKVFERNYGFNNGLPIVKEYYKCYGAEKNEFIPVHSLMRNVLFSGQSHFILIMAFEIIPSEYYKITQQLKDIKNLNNYVAARKIFLLIDTKTGKPVDDFLQYSCFYKKFNHEILEEYDIKKHLVIFKTPYLFS
jgi:hypothetical protein